MQKIIRYSRIISWAIVVAALCHFILWASAVFGSADIGTAEGDSQSTNFSVLAQFVFDDHSSEIEQLNTTGWNGLLWLSLPEMLIIALIYFTVFSLFKCYQRGDIFTDTPIVLIQKTGKLLLIWPLISFIYPPLVILTLRLAGVLTSGEINIALGSDEIRLLVFGLMIFVIGWIMREAKKLQDEQELTI